MFNFRSTKVRPLRERLYEKISPEPNSGCWLWLGCTNHLGYATIWHNKQMVVAHRILYELESGMVPKGLELDHLCRTRCCVNPAHLEAVTHRENVMRGLVHTQIRTKSTHCRRGHLLTGKNVYVYKGKNLCVVCRHIWVAANTDRINRRKQIRRQVRKEKIT